MIRQNKTGKGSNEKNHIFEIGDIVKIVPNHRPFSIRDLTMKYPHGKERLDHICFIEQVLGDRYSLYALEKPHWWYVGDILGSCLEYVRKITTEELENYKHFIYSDDLEKILCRIKQQEIEEEQL